jgi:hypothetical protein
MKLLMLPALLLLLLLLLLWCVSQAGGNCVCRHNGFV